MSYIDPRNKVLWHLDRLHDLKRTGKTAAPVNVEIDLSNRCSLGCSWCHFAYTHTRGPLAGSIALESALPGGDLMDPALARRIVDELAAAGVESVTWTGGGEPTLHPDFDAIVEYTTGTGLAQGLYTHGGHINEARAALLKRHCTWVYVSLDECDAESYRHSKQVKGFDRALRGICHLVEAEGEAIIGLGFLLHPNNYQRTREMVILGKQLGVDYVQFRPTIQYRQEAPSELAEGTRWVREAIERLRVYQNDPFVVADLARFEDYRTWSGHGYSTCNWSAMQTVITPNGKVWRCLNKRQHPGAELGDLSQESFADIWQRNGGSCVVDGGCRVMCRGHISNLTLSAVLTEPVHAEFI